MIFFKLKKNSKSEISTGQLPRMVTQRLVLQIAVQRLVEFK